MHRPASAASCADAAGCSTSGRPPAPAGWAPRAAAWAPRPRVRHGLLSAVPAPQSRLTGGITRAAGADAAQQLQADDAYQEAGQFLRSIGIENRAEVARVLDIAMNPNSLHRAEGSSRRDGNPLARKLSVDGDLRPLLDFLLAQGFTQEEAAKVVVEYPAVLCYSPQERLQPFFGYLRQLGIAQPHRTVLQRPSLLGLTADGSLRQMVDYLQQNGHSVEQIEQLLATTL